MRARRLAASILAGFVVSLLLSSGVVSAHTKTAGSADQYPPSTIQYWRFVPNTYPWPTSWATPAIEAALGTGANSLWGTANHSRMPLFVKDQTNGQGKILWTNQNGSPCSGSTSWLGCARRIGLVDWEIHIRDITNANVGLGSGVHWEEHPSATGTLFLMKRVALHEAMHNVLNVPNHDSQPTTDTIMQAESPSTTQAGGMDTSIKRCDLAAAQFEYDVKNNASPYGDCFDHITNAGSNGLKTKLNLASPDLTKCNGQAMTFNGTLTVGLDSTNYGLLSGNILGSRTVYLDRRPIGGSWTQIASAITNVDTGAYTFSVTYTTSQTWEFKTRFSNASGLTGRDSIEILRGSWSTTC